MNRRFFLVGAAAGVLSLRSASSSVFAQSETDAPPLPIDEKACTYPVSLMDRTQSLIDTLRTRLASVDLLDASGDMVAFYDKMVARYEAAFAAVAEDRLGEVGEAAEILDDPACWVAAPPDEGCVYYEAWKYFSHRQALDLYPADGSVAFRTLSEQDQVRVAEGTVAYAGMLQNIFGSLMDHYGLAGDLSVLTADLYAQSEDMNTLLAEAALPCPIDEVPPSNTPIIRAVPRGEDFVIA